MANGIDLLAQLEFRRNPADRRPLAEQLTALLRREILSGSFPAGRPLPSVRTLSTALGVSHVVAWKAIHALAEEGLVAARTSSGSLVLPSGGKIWRGRVLLVERDSSGSYYASALAEEIAKRLSDAGYILERELLTRDARGNFDFSRLELKLRDPLLLVVQMHEDPRITKYLAQFRVPIAGVVRQRRRIPGAVMTIRSNHLLSAAAVAKRCREHGLKTVWQIGGWAHGEEAAVLRQAGLRVREFVFAPREGGFELEEVQLAALRGVAAWFRRGQPPWPDLLRFTDDFTAMGALQGLMLHGVRIPETVRVVTLANRGFGPVYHRPLSREEMDPFAHGQIVASAIIGYLQTGRAPTDVTLDAVYVDGETFP